MTVNDVKQAIQSMAMDKQKMERLEEHIMMDPDLLRMQHQMQMQSTNSMENMKSQYHHNTSRSKDSHDKSGRLVNTFHEQKTNELTIDIPETDIRMSHKQKQQLNHFLEKKRTTLISVQNPTPPIPKYRIPPTIHIMPKSARASAEYTYTKGGQVDIQ